MGRGVRLACESCGYWSDLFEQCGPGAEAASAATTSQQLADATVLSYLCPQCVEPVELPATDPAVCPRCAAPLLDYATAAEELAGAARTRAAFDLRSERAGREQVVQLLAYLGSLRIQEHSRQLAGADARAALLEVLRRRLLDEATAASPWLPLPNTAALDGLEHALGAAPNTAACATLLEARLTEADRTIGTLEHVIDEEAGLPGVPCPRCGTGHLLHWPIWL